MSLNIAQVEELNKKAQLLNSERQKLIGMKESAKASFDKALASYNQKYGVTLTESDLQSEYNSVLAKLNDDFNTLSASVAYIESGAYKNVQQHQIDRSFVLTNEESMRYNNIQETPSTQGTPVTQETVQPPSSVNLGNGVSDQVMSNIQDKLNKVNFIDSSNKEEDISEKPFTPSGWGSSNIDLNTKFASILGNDNE